MGVVEHHKVTGYPEVLAIVDRLKGQQKAINIYFSGSKTGPNGESWCPDCVAVQPVVDKALETVKTPSHFIYVDVGDRAFWKDMKNPFRLDGNFRLMVIPTLLRWKSPERLEGEQCGNGDLLDMFFNDEE